MTQKRTVRLRSKTSGYPARHPPALEEQGPEEQLLAIREPHEPSSGAFQVGQTGERAPSDQPPEGMSIILGRAREQLTKPGAAEPNSVGLESVAFEL
jgi:hypothetical protein